MQKKDETSVLGKNELGKLTVVIGLLAAGYGLWQWYSASAVSGWTQVTGKVIESRFMPPDRAQIIYEYRHPRASNMKVISCGIRPEQATVRIAGSIGGHLYSQLQSCRNFAAVFDSRQEAEQVVERFPVGKIVQVRSGDSSYLDPRPYRSPWWYWLGGGGGAILAGILILLFSPAKDEAADEPEADPGQGGRRE